MYAEILRIINVFFFYLFGMVILVHIGRNWKKPEKDRTRYSEIIYGILFFTIGTYIYFMFSNQAITGRAEGILYLIMFIAIFGTNFFVFVLNIIPNMMKVKKNPSLLDNDPVMTRNYMTFLEIFEQGTEEEKKAKDVKKDLSRKLLHIIQFTAIIAIHYGSFQIEPWLNGIGMTPMAFRNTVFIFIASVFMFMFTGADLVRITNFQYLPDWARKWYYVSLDPKSEAYTINSAVPFLLTALLFMYSPFNILISAATVSCIADGVASVVGKSFGKHKFNSFGKFPNKSFEGLIAGMLTAFGGVVLVFSVLIPSDEFTFTLSLVAGLISAFIFLLVDAFSTKLADNILNTFLPGVFFHLLILIF